MIAAVSGTNKANVGGEEAEEFPGLTEFAEFAVLQRPQGLQFDAERFRFE